MPKPKRKQNKPVLRRAKKWIPKSVIVQLLKIKVAREAARNENKKRKERKRVLEEDSRDAAW